MILRYREMFPVVVLGLLLTLGGCRTTRSMPGEVQAQAIQVTGSRVEMNADWDRDPDPVTAAILAPYKAVVDSIMTPVVGRSAMDMSAGRPESLLSNLVADVFRQSAVPYLGRPADLAVVNMGGLRNSLSAGDITYGTIYEILPFENSLCLLILKGSTLKQLMENIAVAGGEGISNARLVITRDGKLVSATVGGEEIQDERRYVVATLDYLAEGNDKLSAFRQSEERLCPEGATIRDIFLEYVRDQAGKGLEVTSRIDGRITIHE
ncbi:MAG: 5'-nucleotidase C-terminal domain-containing protein [Bacteroides sp.]|nr:5'-nucleotidase C-terminal domain-containing protein [Bacteroides sp.]